MLIDLHDIHYLITNRHDLITRMQEVVKGDVTDSDHGEDIDAGR